MLKKKNIAMAMAATVVATSVAPAFAATLENGTVISTSDAKAIEALREEVKGYLDVKYTKDADKLYTGSNADKCAYRVTVDGSEITEIRGLDKKIAELKKEGQTLEVSIEDLGHKVIDGEVVDWKTVEYKKGEVVGTGSTAQQAAENLKATGEVESVDVLDSKTISVKLKNNDKPLVITEGDTKLDIDGTDGKVIYKEDQFGNKLDKDGKITTTKDDYVVLGFKQYKEGKFDKFNPDEEDKGQFDTVETKKITVKFGNVIETKLKVSDLYEVKIGRFTSKGNELIKYIRDYNAKAQADLIKATPAADGLSVEISVPKSPESLTKAAGDYATITVVGSKSEVTAFADALNTTDLNGSGADIQTLAGKDRQETAIEVSRKAFNDGTAKNVVLVSDYSLADGLAATPFAKEKEAPILLTGKDGISKTVMAEIERAMKDGGKVYLVGGTSSLSENIEKQLDAKFIDFERIAGEDRYETSLRIAEQMTSKDEVFVTGGYAEADAMSIAAVAARGGNAAADANPILLVHPESGLTAGQKTFLNYNKNSIKSAFVVGGQSNVPSIVEEQLKAKDEKDRVVERIAGADRQETNAKVINKFYRTDNTVDTLYVAKSDNKGLVDALAGGVLAAEKGPIVLATDELSASQEGALSKALVKADLNKVQIGNGIASQVWEKIAKIFK